MLVPLFLFLFIFSIYLLTGCASFNVADSGETITACDLLGLGHPPSYPLHALWGRLHCLLPLGQPMLRVTLSSMVTGALSAVMAYLLLKKILGEMLNPAGSEQTAPGGPKLRRYILEASSLFGALTFAFSSEHWFESCGAKGGVYTLNTLATVTMFFLLFKMRENGWFIKSSLLMGFVFGLGLAGHWENQVVMAPSYLWFFLAGQKRVPFGGILKSLLRPFDLGGMMGKILSAFGFSKIIQAVSFGILSLSVYLYLPLRAVQDPVFNWWDPQTLSRFWGSVARIGFRMEKRATEWPMIGRNIGRFFLAANHQYGGFFTYLVLLLMVLGVRWLWRRNQWATAAGFLFFAGTVLTAVILYNGLEENMEWVLDYFFPPVFLAVSLLAAAGIAWWCLWVAHQRPGQTLPLATAVACSLGFSFLPLLLNDKSNDQSHYVASYDLGLNMLKTAKDEGAILCDGDIDIMPLWYLQLVEGKRPRVASLTLQLMCYDWYRDWLFKNWPQLGAPFNNLPFGDYGHEEPFIQNMIDRRAGGLSFYFTNVATPPWIGAKNPSVPEGLLWRILKTRNLGYPFTSAGLNQFWETCRLRYLNPPERGYWDDYTEYVKNTYGLSLLVAGHFALQNGSFETALWSLNRALEDSPASNIPVIYYFSGESQLALDNPAGAITDFQETLNRGARDPAVYSKLGSAFLRIKDSRNAETAFRAALSINPNQKEALDGLQSLKEVR
jgi:tetratricopeptide (TPR) repeat protein